MAHNLSHICHKQAFISSMHKMGSIILEVFTLPESSFFVFDKFSEQFSTTLTTEEGKLLPSLFSALFVFFVMSLSDAHSSRMTVKQMSSGSSEIASPLCNAWDSFFFKATNFLLTPVLWNVGFTWSWRVIKNCCQKEVHFRFFACFLLIINYTNIKT